MLYKEPILEETMTEPHSKSPELFSIIMNFFKDENFTPSQILSHVGALTSSIFFSLDFNEEERMDFYDIIEKTHKENLKIKEKNYDRI